MHSEESFFSNSSWFSRFIILRRVHYCLDFTAFPRPMFGAWSILNQVWSRTSNIKSDNNFKKKIIKNPLFPYCEGFFRRGAKKSTNKSLTKENFKTKRIGFYSSDRRSHNHSSFIDVSAIRGLIGLQIKLVFFFFFFYSFKWAHINEDKRLIFRK